MSKDRKFGQEDGYELLAQGKSGLSRDLVKTLSKNLKSNPHDVKSRLLLVGHFSRNRSSSSLVRHVKWMIENLPASELHLFLSNTISDKAAEQLKEQWHQTIRSSPKSSKVLINASFYFRSTSPADSVTLLHRACQIEPDSDEILRLLSHSYMLLALSSSESERKKFAQSAVEQMCSAVALFAVPNPGDSYFLPYFDFELEQIAEFALREELYNEAARLSELLLNKQSLFSRRLQAGNTLRVPCDLASNYGYAIKGRIALAQGRIAEAEELLCRMMSLRLHNRSDTKLAYETLAIDHHNQVAIKYLAATKAL